MNGTDWLAVLVLTGIVVLVVCVDGIRRHDDERAERDAQRAAHRRLLDELERH